MSDIKEKNVSFCVISPWKSATFILLIDKSPNWHTIDVFVSLLTILYCFSRVSLFKSSLSESVRKIGGKIPLKMIYVWNLIYEKSMIPEIDDRNGLSSLTGWAIKIRTLYFDLTLSHDENPCNFESLFFLWYIELSFEV